MKKNIMLLFIAMLGLSWYTAVSEAVNNPKKVQEHLQKAAELEEKGIYVDAVTEYEQALEYAPEDSDIYIRMADAYRNGGDSRKFTSTCEKAAEAFQEDTKAMDLLMEYYMENDYESKAVKYLTNFLEAYPDNENAQKWFLELKGSYTELYCRYEEMSDIVNDSMVVMEDGLYGIADAEGREIIAAEYEELQPFSKDGFALAKKDGGDYLYIDRDGQTRKVPDEIYQTPGMISEDRAAVCRDGKYGYLDEEMEPAGEFVWEELTGIKNSTGAGKRDGKWVLVNKNGEPKTEERYEDVVMDKSGFCSNQERIFVKTGKAYFLIDRKGKRIGELTFDDAKAFTENGYAAVCRGDKWGFVNQDGELVTKYQYEEAESFQNGYAAVCIGGLWGYIDADGQQIIDCRFTGASHFSKSGTAAVKIENDDGEDEWKLIRLNIFS